MLRAGVAVFPHDPIVRFAGREMRAVTSDMLLFYYCC